MSSMAGRLSKLENLSRVQKEEIKEKTGIIGELKTETEKYKLLASRAMGSDDPANREFLNKYEQIQRDNLRLESENAEMKSFLLNYGFKWKGSVQESEGQFMAHTVNQQLDVQGPIYRNNLPKEIDLEVIARRIQELNFIARINLLFNIQICFFIERDAKHVKKRGGVHKIEVS